MATIAASSLVFSALPSLATTRFACKINANNLLSGWRPPLMTNFRRVGLRNASEFVVTGDRWQRESRSIVRAEAGSEPEGEKEKVPFGYTRKDVLLIGAAIVVAGFILKYGLEFAGLEAGQAGNVVQLVLVLGLTLGWTATYVFRVGNKDMTYVKQLKEYEDAVMQKRLEELPEAELEAMLAEIEEEKLRLAEKRKGKLI